ncbi:uridine kinase [Trueperella sp. LYQ143]|uniref:uridine kinase family protein n=1 Tax=unclassified Trueperella TaxID=2630174 RepID=UPI00398382D6
MGSIHSVNARGSRQQIIAKVCAAAAEHSLFIIGIDGRSGAGKTTLAHEIAQQLLSELNAEEATHNRAESPVASCSVPSPPAIVTIEVEDYIRGWDRLVADIPYLAVLLAELRQNGYVWARPWDWQANRPGPLRRLPQYGYAQRIIVVGSGAISAHLSTLLDCRIWLEASSDLRQSRVRYRDAYDWSAYWQVWAQAEEQLRAESASDARADYVLHTDEPETLP